MSASHSSAGPRSVPYRIRGKTDGIQSDLRPDDCLGDKSFSSSCYAEIENAIITRGFQSWHSSGLGGEIGEERGGHSFGKNAKAVRDGGLSRDVAMKSSNSTRELLRGVSGSGAVPKPTRPPLPTPPPRLCILPRPPPSALSCCLIPPSPSLSVSSSLRLTLLSAQPGLGLLP